MVERLETNDTSVVNIENFNHLRKKKKKKIQVKTEAQKEELAYQIMVSASGLPDFEAESSLYIWYATEYCFSSGIELRDITIERKLRKSDPALQRTF